MEANASKSLPWDALGNTRGDIPWAALDQFADAAVADRDVLEELLDLYDGFQETVYERGSFECLYVPAILAMAAPRLSDTGRDRAARFLLRSLMIAGATDDEPMQDVLPAAIGALGPETVLPVIPEFMPEDYQPWEAAFGLWQMAKLACQTDDPGLREPIIKLCTEALEKAERGLLDIGEVDYAGFVLARIGHVESRPLIQRLYDKTELGDLKDSLDLLDGKRVPPADEDAWDIPVAEWLTENWKFLREWYEGGHDAEGDTEEEQYGAAYRRAEELAAEFAKSAAMPDQPPDVRDDARAIALFLMENAWVYAGAKPEDLDEPVLQEVLLEVFPRKISGSKLFFERTIPATQAFLDWLEAKGILTDVAGLKQTIGKWHKEIVHRGNDPRYWGMAKGFVMTAQDQGVDLGDEEAMDRFMGEYNSQIEQIGQYEPAERDSEPVTAPIVRDGAKVGRNEPCPCGSGKKYKKCCGR